MSKFWDNTVSDIEQLQKSAHGRNSKLSFNLNVSVKKPHRIFLMRLFTLLRLFQGKATFRNLSRYSEMHEKRFSRWYRRAFDFAQFNARLLDHELPRDHERIAAIDASFMKKSGKHTEGLGYFYQGQAGKAEKGLEISLVSLIECQHRLCH